MTDFGKGWRDLANELDEFMLDIQISNFAPINPKPQYDLALAGYKSALIGLRQSPDRLRQAKRVRILGSRLWELTELMYGRSSGSEMLRSRANEIFGEAGTHFEDEANRFRSQPTLENAEVVRELGAWYLETARFVMTRPSPRYQVLFDTVLQSLRQVADYARRQ